MPVSFLYGDLLMELSINTPALLFPAISLLLLAYTNRFLALANLVRKLPDELITGQKSKLLLKQKNSGNGVKQHLIFRSFSVHVFISTTLLTTAQVSLMGKTLASWKRWRICLPILCFGWVMPGIHEKSIIIANGAFGIGPATTGPYPYCRISGNPCHNMPFGIIMTMVPMISVKVIF